jgi:hypothetical protein
LSALSHQNESKQSERNCMRSAGVNATNGLSASRKWRPNV